MPKKDVLVITGDWNAKIGQYSDAWKGVMGKFGHGDRNDRGERLLEFAKINEMYICNTRKDGKPSRKWTWLSPCGRYRNMIDYVMIQRRWSSAVRECRTFPGADIDSDHNLVLAVQHIAPAEAAKKATDKERMEHCKLTGPRSERGIQ